ncbi:hypothetical protein HYX16_01340 [Candidatus Woesearchaeota archaeon]|nr:hypothetical protein [Candidatus Woesearchaeota archaeon]
MVKIKPLLSSLKERKRYLLYKITGVEKIEKEFIYEMIKKFLGELGTGKAGVMMLNSKGNKGIIRVNHDHVDEVRVALGLINNYDNNDVKVETIKVSGAINKLKEGI